MAGVELGGKIVVQVALYSQIEKVESAADPEVPGDIVVDEDVAILPTAGIAAENFPFCTIEPNTGVVPVPDERLRWLSKAFNTKSSSTKASAQTARSSSAKS